jgi:hypothetical protein
MRLGTGRNVGARQGRRGGLAYLARGGVGMGVLTGQGLFYAPQEFPNRGNSDATTER